MCRSHDARGRPARDRYLESAARGVGDALCHAPVRADRTERLRTGVRCGHRRTAGRDRGHREESRQAFVPQYDRRAGTFRRTAFPNRRVVLQPARSRFQRRDAAHRARRAAQADGAEQRHRARSGALRPREGRLRESRLVPFEGGQAAVGEDLQELRPQRCGASGRQAGALPAIYDRVGRDDAQIRSEFAGCDQRLHAQHHRSRAGRRAARLREGGAGGRRQGARREGLDGDVAVSELRPLHDLFVGPRGEGAAVAGVECACAGRRVRQLREYPSHRRSAPPDRRSAGI